MTRLLFRAYGPERPSWPTKPLPRLVVDVTRGPYRDGLTSSVPTTRSHHSRGADSCTRYSEDHNEAAVSAQRAQAGKEAWFPFAYEHPWRTRRPSHSSRKGPRPPVGVIDRLTGRVDFARLRVEGVRHGHGPIRLVSRFEPAADDEVAPQAPIARFAFAIPRSVGNAVVRNRIRRRIRAVLHDLHHEDDVFPARGDHLIRVTVPIDDWSHTRLCNTMTTLLKPTLSSEIYE
jgi:ribonuclease P protein component